MIVPNNDKILINGGLIDLFSGDKRQESNAEKSFNNLIHMLEMTTKEVAYLLEESSENEQNEQIDQLIPALQISLSTINSLILLLDYSKP